MDFALFSNLENPFDNPSRAIAELVATVRHAEELGFGAAWITEHHFNHFSLSADPVSVLAYLAARTRNIRLGAGTLLLALHDPVQAAEQIATLDLLSEGRLLLGVGKGGPFPDQFRHFHIPQEEARPRLLEALDLVTRALAEPQLDFAGQWYRCEGLTVQPRPLRPQMPVWIASMSPEGIAHAAAYGYGLMLPSPAPLPRVTEIFGAYRAARAGAGVAPWRGAAGEGQPLALARFFLCAPSNEEARRVAGRFISEFSRNMGAVFAQIPRPFNNDPEAFSEERLLANAIVGDPAACRDKILALGEALGDFSLLLKPASYDPADARTSLSLFAEQVRPQLPA